MAKVRFSAVGAASCFTWVSCAVWALGVCTGTIGLADDVPAAETVTVPAESASGEGVPEAVTLTEPLEVAMAVEMAPTEVVSEAIAPVAPVIPEAVPVLTNAVLVSPEAVPVQTNVAPVTPEAVVSAEIAPVLENPELVQGNAKSASVETGPVEAGLVKTGPVEAVPVETGPVEAVLVEADPVEAVPVEAVLPADASPVASEDAEVTPESFNVALLLQENSVSEHPLDPMIRWAKANAVEIQKNVRDYSCTMVKQERINGLLHKKERLFIKVRHEPFSVYLRFDAPRVARGREVVFVENECDGCLQAHGIGLEAVVGTVRMVPDGPLALSENLHPITDTGLLRMALQLAEEGEKQKQKPLDKIAISVEKSELNGIPCVRLEIRNLDRCCEEPFCKAHIYVDIQRNIPISYTAWGWPECEGGEPILLETYTYEDIQFNQNFQDIDFQIENPCYNFREGKVLRAAN